MVLITREPWWLLEGFDTPAFALYSDGLVIYANRETAFPPFYSAILNSRETAELLDAVPAGKALSDLGRRGASVRSGQPSNRIYRWDHSREVESSWAPGNIDTRRQRDLEAELERTRGDSPIRPALENDLANARKDRRDAPQPFLAIYDSLLGYEHPRATPWIPRKVKVVIWPFVGESVPVPEPQGWIHIFDKKPIPWPKSWPGLDNQSTSRLKRHNEIYEIWVPGKHLRALMQMRGRVISLEGRLWKHRMRVPFPSEESWRPW